MARNAGGVCPYFLRGNCRFGERCWNEHPRYGRPNQGLPQNQDSNRRGGWSGHNQRYSNVIQTSSFSKSSNWNGNREGGPSSFSQNRFAALGANDNVSTNGIKDEEEKLLEIIVKDMEIWESSGQWMFSTYSPMKEKPNISGFQDFLPEELRLEYYNCQANNAIQNYINSIQQLVTQWRSRLHELKNINGSNKTRLIAELKNVTAHPQPAFGFGVQQPPAFGTSTFPVNNQSSAQAFSFKSPPEPSNVPAPAFGNLASVQGATVPPPASHSVGFGNPAPSATASFSFKTTAASYSLGAPGFSNFGKSFPSSSSDTAPASGFGTPTAPPALDSGNTPFGQTPSAFGSQAASASPAIPTTVSSGKQFTPKNELSEEELKQFEAKKFTLGNIPLKPPPLELLSMQFTVATSSYIVFNQMQKQ
ncbi:nucleoporin NUP42 isoform X1 [Anolis sagrei]|uniref:nucleoporin NUP42 isoform X1 n=1 Tax=Anolis sagrei TaxID=38937 RepID=UPI003522253F